MSAIAEDVNQKVDNRKQREIQLDDVYFESPAGEKNDVLHIVGASGEPVKVTARQVFCLVNSLPVFNRGMEMLHVASALSGTAISSMDEIMTELADLLPDDKEAVCIGCGCSQYEPCHTTKQTTCTWLRVLPSQGAGVCSECPDHVAEFDEKYLDKKHECGGDCVSCDNCK